MSEIVIPFGPYRSRPVREIAVLNLQYLKTLPFKSWFHEQYKNHPCYELILCYAGTDARETPAHNALQARFLEDDFCLAVFYVATSIIPANFERISRQIAEDKRRRLLKIEDYKNSIDFYLKRVYSSIESLEDVKNCEQFSHCGPLYAVPSTRRRRIEEAKRADEEYIKEAEERIRAEEEAIDQVATSQYVFRPLKSRGFEDKGDVSLSILVELSKRPDISAVIWNKRAHQGGNQVDPKVREIGGISGLLSQPFLANKLR